MKRKTTGPFSFYAKNKEISSQQSEYKMLQKLLSYSVLYTTVWLFQEYP